MVPLRHDARGRIRHDGMTAMMMMMMRRGSLLRVVVLMMLMVVGRIIRIGSGVMMMRMTTMMRIVWRARRGWEGGGQGLRALLPSPRRRSRRLMVRPLHVRGQRRHVERFAPPSSPRSRVDDAAASDAAVLHTASTTAVR